MPERKTFTLTDEQLRFLLDACKPTPAMWASGGRPLFDSPQENANRAWQKLADEMGFVWDTVQPGRTKMEFTAEVKTNGRAKS